MKKIYLNENGDQLVALDTNGDPITQAQADALEAQALTYAD